LLKRRYILNAILQYCITHYTTTDASLPTRYFLAYVYYIPLFLTGPVISFNAFLSQVRFFFWTILIQNQTITPQATYSLREITISMIKVLLYMLGLEIGLHYFYQNSFNESGMWKKFDPIDVCITGYITLNFMCI
jgi:D-alanyl-lipoteichoic acid acyltransferase DltB (MBOAT superfamily)